MEDHHPMWKKLGLDLEKHDELLGILPTIYKEIYIDSQKNRPDMSFFDFVVEDIHGIRIKELVEAKSKGKKIFGTFCVYIPDEIITALNGISVGLCGGTNFSNYAIEGVLPVNLCPLIKSAVGFKLGKICPYFESLDLLIGETTCDGKKKVWEILAKETDLYVMEVPQCKQRKQAQELFLKELNDLVKKLEEVTGIKLTINNLKPAMKKIKKKREQLRRIYNTRKNNPPPISGKDALLVSQIAFYDDPDRQIQMLGKLADELDARIKNGQGVVQKDTPRILIAGTPMAVPNWKLHHVVETSGAIVVSEETCTGTRYFSGELNINGESVDELLQNIADRYLKINCACFTPNDKRVEDIKQLVKDYKVDGVILYTLSFCQPYEIEAMTIQDLLKKENIPTLQITTDYSSEDVGQLKTRVEAFIEMIKN
ncbi:MAG: 2-hydroxyacyl-CoA dehydratase [Candidatus Lokiarchaeota archaeon]|nr:2-hydroxyacyl-CoA dehydratase [Candidatus Lokiarchaeota archaeon]